MAQFGGEECLGDSAEFVFYPESAGVYFPEDTFTTVQIAAFDCAQFCGENADTVSLAVFVPDDDTLPPAMSAYFPDVWLEDSAFVIVLALVDSSGVYTPVSPTDSQDAYILWDSDGELAASANRAELYADSVHADTVFLSSETIPGQRAHTPFVWRAFFHDDDHDFSRDADRTPGFTAVESVRIIPRPQVRMVFPPESAFVSCPDTVIKIVFTSDEDPIDINTVRFAVEGETLSLADSRCYRAGDTIVILPPPEGYGDGAVEVALISAQTEWGYSLPEYRWVFWVDTEPPEIEFVSPEEWAMLPEPDFSVEAHITDALAGVDTDSVAAFFVVRGETLAPAEVEFVRQMDGYRCVVRSAEEIAAGDTVEVRILACDLAQICPPNCAGAVLNFWIEPDFPCSLSTNPITPNGDGFNDVVRFLYPKPFSHDVKVCIFDLGGREIFCREIPAGDLDAQLWDGTYDGRVLPGGTYIYTIDGDGIHCRGTITIAR